MVTQNPDITCSRGLKGSSGPIPRSLLRLLPVVRLVGRRQMRLAGKRPRIPHVLQSHNWDCGLACVEMAMRALGVAPQECSLRTLRTRVPSTSVWTVDLVHIICSFGVKFRFLTTTIGVNPLYKNEVSDHGPGDLPNSNLTRTLPWRHSGVLQQDAGRGP